MNIITSLRKQPRSMLEQAYKTMLEWVSQDRNTNEKDDPEFCDFIESVSATKEEMAALVSIPELSSIYEAQKYVQEGIVELVSS